MLAQEEDLDKKAFDAMVRTSCEEVGAKHMSRVVLANRRYLRQMLEAADVFEKEGIIEAGELKTGRL